MDTNGDVSEILDRLSTGERGAFDQLMPLVHRELQALAKQFMRAESPDHILQTTGLVNEAYLRLVDQTRVRWNGRGHFFAVASRAMRRILVDHARARDTRKRGAGFRRIPLSELAESERSSLRHDLLDLDEALEKLVQQSPRAAQVVEMRYFAALSIVEIAKHLGVTRRTIERDWTFAQAWLFRELSTPGS